MAEIIQLGNVNLTTENLLPLLMSYRLFPHLLREVLIDQAIANIDLNIAESPANLRQLKLQEFKSRQWGSKLEPYFLKRKPQLDQVVYSIIRTKDPGLTQELYFRLQAQEQSFAELAQTYSEGLEAHTNGIVGPVSIGHLPLPLSQRFLGGQPGQVWRPFQFQGWFVIVKLERLLPAQLTEAVCQLLLNELFEDWLQKELAQQLANLSSSQNLHSPSLVAA